MNPIVEERFSTVIKRDGRSVPFDKNRIKEAVAKAMESSGEVDDVDTMSGFVRDQVMQSLSNSNSYAPSIEEIQDIVETELVLADLPKTAKHYILYRHERAEIRAQQVDIPEHVKDLVAHSKEYFQNSYGEFIFFRTYSRFNYEENRRETWIEAVDRYMAYMTKVLGDKLTVEEYREVRGAILRQEVMPSMRLAWSAGDAAEADHATAYNCSFTTVTSLQDFAEILYLLMCGCGVGFSVERQNIEQLPIVAFQDSERTKDYIAVLDSKDGWADALKYCMDIWYSGGDIEIDYSFLRPAGARLRTMGGRSAGPEPLIELMNFTRTKILARQGRRLTSLDVHDIVCKIGDIVVSGGVRRSSLISLSDLDDIEMRNAKQGHFFLENGHRRLANNSVAYQVKPSQTEFMEEWIALAKSGSGERGIFNRANLAQQIPSRRLRTIEDALFVVGTNPCVSIYTWVLTSEGPRKVIDLIGRPFTAVVDGEQYVCPSGFFKSGTQMLYKIKTNLGFELEATSNHKVLVVSYRTRKTQRNEWCEVGQLEPGDKIILNNHFDYSWKGNGTHLEGWLLGNLLGDGNIERDGFANLDYWGETSTVMAQSAESVLEMSGRSGRTTKTAYGYRIHSRSLGELAECYGMQNNDKHVTDEIEKASSYFYEGFLAGWFDADGSVQGNLEKGVSIRLSSSNIDHLIRAQRMLARLGIVSKVYENRRDAGYHEMPNTDRELEEYWCEANHELIISKDNIITFEMRIGFSDPFKSARLKTLIDSYRRGFNREPFYAEVLSVSEYGVNDVYDCQVDTINAFDANGLYVHNCGEIFLKPKQFCNLTEVIARSDDTLKTLKQKIRIASILGTYQSMLTNFPYLSKEWKENCEQERLLGVSVTGQWDSATWREVDTQRWSKGVAVDTNIEYAERFGINPSTAVTCVKPSGTVSQLVNASSGMHTRHSPYFIRRVRISATDPLFQMMRDQKWPHDPEVGQSYDEATTFVLHFPIKAPEGSKYRNDLSALEQLEYWKQVKNNFTEHNPSCTIYVGEDEWLDVGHWVYKNWEIIGGLSFLPRDVGVYRLAPYQEITKEQYEKMVDELPEVDFSRIVAYEREDNTTGAKTYACVGDQCEI
jgi:ribonucleotide reductase, class II